MLAGGVPGGIGAGGGVFGVGILEVVALLLIEGAVLVLADHGDELHDLGGVGDRGVLCLAGRLAHRVGVGAGGGEAQAGGVVGVARDVVGAVEVDHAGLVVGGRGDHGARLVVDELEGELARLEGAALEHLDDLRVDVADLVGLGHGAVGRAHGVAAQREGRLVVVIVVGRLHVAVERANVGLGLHRHVVADEGATGAARAKGERGVGRKHAGGALLDRNAGPVGVVEVVQHVAGVAELGVDLADANGLAVDAQVGLRNRDGAHAAAVDVDDQACFAFRPRKVVDVDVLVAAHQLGCGQVDASGTIEAIVDGNGAHLALVAEGRRGAHVATSRQGLLKGSGLGMHGIDVDEGVRLGIGVLHEGVGGVELSAVNRKVAVVVHRSDGVAAADDEGAAFIFGIGVGVAGRIGIVLDVAQALEVIDATPAIHAKVVAPRQLLGENVAIDMAFDVHLVERSDVEASGKTELGARHGIAIRVVLGRVEGVRLGVQAVGVFPVGARVKRCTLLVRDEGNRVLAFCVVSVPGVGIRSVGFGLRRGGLVGALLFRSGLGVALGVLAVLGSIVVLRVARGIGGDRLRLTAGFQRIGDLRDRGRLEHERQGHEHRERPCRERAQRAKAALGLAVTARAHVQVLHALRPPSRR